MAAGMFGMLGITGVPGGGNARNVASAFGIMPPCAFATRPLTVAFWAAANDAVSKSIATTAASRHLTIHVTSGKIDVCRSD
jgi:hypothetical protein